MDSTFLFLCRFEFACRLIPSAREDKQAQWFKFGAFLLQADVTELAASPLALARQLTHIELERLSYIGPEEFVQAFAKEHPGVDPNCKEAKKTRNLELYVAWFNRLSYLVATEVCKVNFSSFHSGKLRAGQLHSSFV